MYFTIFVFVQFLWNSVSPRLRPHDPHSCLVFCFAPALNLHISSSCTHLLITPPITHKLLTSCKRRSISPLFLHFAFLESFFLCLQSCHLFSLIQSLYFIMILFTEFYFSWHLGSFWSHNNMLQQSSKRAILVKGFCNCQWWTLTLTHKQMGFSFDLIIIILLFLILCEFADIFTPGGVNVN